MNCRFEKCRSKEGDILSKQAETTFDALPLFLTVPQVAAVLGIGRNTAYGMIRNGQLRSVRVGRQIRVPKDALKTIQ